MPRAIPDRKTAIIPSNYVHLLSCFYVAIISDTETLVKYFFATLKHFFLTGSNLGAILSAKEVNRLKERIKELRKTLGLTQQEFADRLGISRGNIATYETRNSSPGNSVVNLICREFNVREAWLRTGKGDMFQPKTRSDEIDAFMREILRDDSDFRQKFISVLARMTADEWKLLERKVLELASEVTGGENAAREDSDDAVERDVEDYRRRRVLEKNQAAGSSPSSEGGAETA